MEPWGFKIIEFSIRLLDSGECYEVNLRFTVDPKHERRENFDRLAQDWVEPEFWLFNKADYKQYLAEEVDDPEFNLEDCLDPPDAVGSRRLHLPETAYSRLLDKRLDTTLFVSMRDAVLNHDSTTDEFTYNEYVTKNPTVDGILQHLRDLQNGISYGNFVTISQFQHCLESLDKFWD